MFDAIDEANISYDEDISEAEALVKSEQKAAIAALSKRTDAEVLLRKKLRERSKRALDRLSKNKSGNVRDDNNVKPETGGDVDRPNNSGGNGGSGGSGGSGGGGGSGGSGGSGKKALSNKAAKKLGKRVCLIKGSIKHERSSVKEISITMESVKKDIKAAKEQAKSAREETRAAISNYKNKVEATKPSLQANTAHYKKLVKLNNKDQGSRRDQSRRANKINNLYRKIKLEKAKIAAWRGGIKDLKEVLKGISSSEAKSKSKLYKKLSKSRNERLRKTEKLKARSKALKAKGSKVGKYAKKYCGSSPTPVEVTPI